MDAHTLYQHGTLAIPGEPVTLGMLKTSIGDPLGKNCVGFGTVVDWSGKLVGDMVMLHDGNAYMMTDKPRLMTSNPDIGTYKLTFAQIARLDPEYTLPFMQVSGLEDLQRQIAAIYPSQEQDKCVVRVTGKFPRIDFASGESLENAECTLVGIYNREESSPLKLVGMNREHSVGGQVTGFSSDKPFEVRLEGMPIEQQVVLSPEQTWQGSIRPITDARRR